MLSEILFESHVNDKSEKLVSDPSSGLKFNLFVPITVKSEISKLVGWGSFVSVHSKL